MPASNRKRAVADEPLAQAPAKKKAAKQSGKAKKKAAPPVARAYSVSRSRSKSPQPSPPPSPSLVPKRVSLQTKDDVVDVEAMAKDLAFLKNHYLATMKSDNKSLSTGPSAPEGNALAKLTCVL
jgi:hypothetical protein